MPRKTVVSFFCDACDALLSSDYTGDKPSSDCEVSFKFFVAGEWAMEISTEYNMLCNQCKKDLIKLVRDFQREKRDT